ncbi:hypothetical protein LLH00_07500 [bacterium]|nr:hypothetical protein [bacterium]
MERYHLYYAGMAANQTTEQIGLAVSVDGEHFTRHGSDGLILTMNREQEWKNLRVCNPTVIKEGDEYLMFYQGVGEYSDGVVRTSIGLARSQDGLEWTPESEPMIDWRRLEDGIVKVIPNKRIDLIEPSVLKEDGVFRMWFVVKHDNQPGNSLFHAISKDLRTWEIDTSVSLSGNCFGPCRIFYPQVLKDGDIYRIYFTLNNQSNSSYGIFSMQSMDGKRWERLEQLLPESYDGFVLKPREYFACGLHSWTLRKIQGKINRNMTSLLRKGRNYFGYAHPHRLSVSGGRTLMYIHNVNDGGFGRTLDIGLFDLINGKPYNYRHVLTPRRNTPAWDAEFVADPYVISIC